MTDAEGVLATTAHNLRRWRRGRGLTLQELADQSGVSKRMIAMIEKAETNPSIMTIARLATALRLSFGDLIGVVPQGPVEVRSPGDFVTAWQGEEGSVARLLLTSTPPDPVELWEWRLLPGGSYQALADPAGTEELIWVLEGTLRLDVEGTAHVIPAGSAVRLQSDRLYSYHAELDVPTRFVRVVVLPHHTGT